MVSVTGIRDALSVKEWALQKCINSWSKKVKYLTWHMILVLTTFIVLAAPKSPIHGQENDLLSEMSVTGTLKLKFLHV